MKVYIAVCSGRDWKAAFGASLGGMLLTVSKIPGLQAAYLNVLQASGQSRARQMAAKDAIRGGFTHILYLDDDMYFPPHLLAKMLERNLEAVAINYARKEPGNRNAIAFGLDGQGIFSKDKKGVEEVWGFGFGAVLIELKPLKEMPFPWFEHRWLEDKEEYMGEDMYFCMKARAHGIKIYIDHDLSNQCAHIGDYPYKEA